MASPFPQFSALYPFGLDEFQVQGCAALDEGHGVLVAAPTGAGKTVVGEYAVFLALNQGRKCFYTTPIKALSNQKFADLVKRHGAANVGLLTGDNSINGDAPVVVMTTEVLRNMLYAGSSALDGLGFVVMDEVHYLADRFRGAVWEEVIIHLPESVQLVVPLRDRVQRGGVRRVAGDGARLDHDHRLRAPAGTALAARAGGREDLRPLQRGGPGDPGRREGEPGAGALLPAGGAARAAGGGAGARPGSGAAGAPVRRAGWTSSTGWTPRGCCPRSPSSSRAPAARRPCSSSCAPACGC